MSIITIIAKPPITTAAYFRLHQLLKRSIAEIKSSVKLGSPIFNEELFDNNYEEKNRLLRKLLAIAHEENIHLELFEALSSLDWNDGMRISEEILVNIIHPKD